MAYSNNDRQRDKQLDPRIKAMAKVVREKVTIVDYMQDVAYEELGGYFGEVPFQYRDVCCCCLHHEKTASMRYYPDTNSFYCFGCDTGGNVITLHMEFVLKNRGIEITYEEAVEFLYNYFIMENKTAEMSKEKSKVGMTAEEIQALQDEEREISEDTVNIMRFTKAVAKVESLLLSSLTIPIDLKNSIYTTIDALELMVDVKKLNAESAFESLKILVLNKAGIRL